MDFTVPDSEWLWKLCENREHKELKSLVSFLESNQTEQKNRNMLFVEKGALQK